MNYDDYMRNLQSFRSNVEEALKVSIHLKGRYSTKRGAWTCLLFTRLCVTCYSALILCPESPVAKKSLPHWDYASLHALTRQIMENFQILYYLCFDEIPEEEYLARKGLFNLHDYLTRKRMFEFMGEQKEDKRVEKQLKENLMKNEYFKLFPEKQQRHFLKGKTPFFVSREEIEANYREKKDGFKWLYMWLSSSVHSSPMGFYRMMTGERGTGVKTEVEVGYCAFSLEIAEQYLSEAIEGMYKIFPGTKEQVLKMKAPFRDLS